MAGLLDRTRPPRNDGSQAGVSLSTTRTYMHDHRGFQKGSQFLALRTLGHEGDHAWGQEILRLMSFSSLQGMNGSPAITALRPSPKE